MCPSRGDSKGVSGKTPLALEVQEGGKRLLLAIRTVKILNENHNYFKFTFE
jgi:hypothetical protein